MLKRLKRKGKKGKVSLVNVRQKIGPATIWQTGDKIGEGAMGEVFKVTKKSGGQVCAAKVLTIESKDDIEEFVTEVDALTVAAGHPNVVRLFDALMFNKKFWVVLEYCKGGAFDDILIARKGQGLSEPQLQSCAIQMLAGMSHLHNLGVFHRDIKGGNLLLNAEGVVKLTDFGSCSLGNHQSSRKHDTFLGSPYWMAPEVIQCDRPGRDRGGVEGYDGKADVWAYGITLIELAQCDPPYQELHPMRAMLKITANPAPSLEDPHIWSDDCFDYVETCLVKEQDYRATASELSQHPFVSVPADFKCLLPIMAAAAPAGVTPSEMLAAQLRNSALGAGFALGSDGNLTADDDEEESFGWG